MNHAGYVFGTYAITFTLIVSAVVYTLKEGRELSRNVADKDKPWT